MSRPLNHPVVRRYNVLIMPKQAGWMRWAPGLLVLREYQASWLAHDVVAGLVLATMVAPVGIAYAVASGLPGIYGLYATIVPLLAYALFGPSRILVLEHSPANMTRIRR